MSSAWNVEVGVKVDPSGVQQQLSNLGLKPIEVDAKLSDASIRNIQSSVTKAFKGNAVDSKTANGMFVGVEKAAAKSAKSVSKIFGTIDLGLIKKSFKEAGFKDSASERAIKIFAQNTERAFKTVSSAKSDILKNGDIRLTVKGTDQLNRAVTQIREFKKTAKGDIGSIDLKRSFEQANETIAQTKRNVSDIIKLTNEKARINIDLSKLDEGSKKAKELKVALKDVEAQRNALFAESAGNLTESQSKRISQAESKANSRVAIAKAGNIDKANLEQTKIEITQLKDVINQIGNQRIKLLGLDETSKDADEARAKLAALEAQAEKMTASLGKTTATQDASITSSLDKMERRVAEEKEKIARSISENVGAKEYATIADNYMRKIDSLNNGSERLKQKGKELKNLAIDISNANSMMEKSAKGSDEWNHAFERANSAKKEFYKTEGLLKNDISQYSGLMKQAEGAEKAALAFDNLNLKKTNFYDSIDVWRKNHSAVIGTDFDTQLTNIQNRIQDIDSPGSLNNLKAEFAQVTNQAQLADKATLNVGDRIKNQLKQYATYFGVAGAMMVGSQGIRSMFNNTLQVDTQMTELRRVTDLSESQYAQLFADMTASAKEYGVALSDVISATADWSRAGFDANTSKRLAEITTMYQHVSDLDYDEAAQNLLTSYKGFEKQLTERYNGDATQAVGHIGDILNELDNKYAVTAAGVGEGLKRSASALDVANNTLEESAAMVAGASEVTQDPK